MSPAGTFLCRALCAVLLCGSVDPTALAQTRAKKEKPAVEASPRAQWRVWKDRFATSRALRVQFRTAARKTPAAEVRLAAEGWQFLDYVEIAAGSATIEISDEAEPKTKLVTLPVAPAAGSFSTLLLRESEGHIFAEWIDDTAPAEALGVAELTVRNFVPELTVLQVRAGEELSARLATPESFLRVRGLPRKAVQIDTAGTEESGKPVRWANEIDFAKVRRATLLIYPDSHGRVRPRVVVDGEIAAEPPAEGQQ